jgi:2-hydroxy-4-carboxymuconate semialdehyde hemiacetal dehydrogenase
MVCHTQRYYPGLVEARRMIAAGELRPYNVVARYMFHRRQNVNWMGRRRTWTDNLIWHHGCHAVDASLWLLGATDVEAQANVALPSGPLGIPMDWSITMRTPRDQLATVSLSYNTHIPLLDYLVIGEQTTLLFDDGELRGPEGRVLVPKPRDEAVADAIGRQDAEFLAAVAEGREPAISGRSVRPAMAALQVAQDTLDRRLRGAQATSSVRR